MFGAASGENCAQETLLYDSKVCRLCGDKNENGRPLFRWSTSNEECETSKLINQYLPVMIDDDGVSPRWICPGCYIQLESTAQFFEMILKGQQLIALLLLQQKQAQEAELSTTKSTRVDDLVQLYDTLDQAKWSDLFGKPESISRDNVLIPLELCELEDLLKQEQDHLVEQPAQQKQLHHSIFKEKYRQPSPKASNEDWNDCAEGKDWIVNSESTRLNGRLIGFLRNHQQTDIGSLVVMEHEGEKKRKHAKFVCDICSKIFVHEARYLKHRKTHSNLFGCPVCSLKFANDTKLTIHQQETQHIGKSIFEGPQLTSVKIKRECYEGGNGDTKQNKPITVLNHEKSAHACESRSFVCCDCGKSFLRKNMLQRHRTTHTEERPHQCTVCDATFKTRSTLTKHTRSHSNMKHYQCTMCNQRFAYKTSLNLHLNWHNGVKPFECEFCSKRFSQRGNLKEHLRVHSGDKPFRCNICSATFATSSQHRLHIKRHANDRPHECELCSKTFILLENYKTHMRRHRNEKPYACEVCSRAFAERWALRKHIRTHTREKPYSCKHCCKPFSDSSNLLRHVVSIHGKETKHEPVTITTSNANLANPTEGRLSDDGALHDPVVSGLSAGANSIDENEALVVLTEDEMLPPETMVYMSLTSGRR